MKLIFKNKKSEAKNVYSFYFTGHQSIKWQAGQSIRLEIDTEYLSDERRFTISSAPSEKHLAITTRVSTSRFKQALAKLRPGDEIKAFAVEGNFVWPKNSSKSPLFLASGLGITPFRSMLAERAKRGEPLGAKLFYAYKTDSAIFKTELDSWQKNYRELKIVYLPDKKLTAAQLGSGLANSSIYISGSSRFVKNTFADLTKDYQVKPATIRLDEFTGLAP